MLDPGEIGDRIREDIAHPGSHIRIFMDAYRRVDHDIGAWVTDPVDRVVVTFVGTKAQAARVMSAAEEVCRPLGDTAGHPDNQ